MFGFFRRFLNYTRSARVGAARFRIPVTSGMEARAVHESAKTHLIRRFARGEGVFLDVGVNLGQTMLDLRASFPHMSYVGFEPNPTAVAYVYKLIEVNGFDNCKVLCAALGERAGTIDLYRTPGDIVDTGATLIKNLRPTRNQTAAQPVALFAFDAIGAELQARPVSFVKVDVEGSELEALKGMTNTLVADRPVVLCEVLPRCGGTSEAASAARRAELRALLSGLDYQIFHVELNGSLEPSAEFKAGPFRKDESWDYVFLPSERLADAAGN